MVATQSLLNGQQLSLTELGRNIAGSVAPKHNIKRIDRLLGLIAQQQHWERAFQANTTRHRRVLSIIRLGREVRKRASDYKISEAQIRWAIGQYIGWVHKEGRPIL